jgi:hypothetical protein
MELLAGGLDDLGQAVGDLGEVAREDLDRGAVLVDLDSGAVELVLEGHLSGVVLESLRQAIRRLGEHGLQGSKQKGTDLLQASVPPFLGREGDFSQIAEEHVRPAHQLLLGVESLADGVEHDPFADPVPHLSQDVLDQVLGLHGRGS